MVIEWGGATYKTKLCNNNAYRLCTVRILKVSNPTYLLQVPKYSNHDLLYVQVLPIQIQRD